MDETFQAVSLPARGQPSGLAGRFGPQNAQRAQRFHSSFSEYRPTPLTKLSSLAGALGLGSLYIKDESLRFGLNAFKVLGGSYAIGRELARRLGEDIASLSFEKLVSPQSRQKLGELTFVTATDGNHGRGVAWTAARLGQKAVVYMPKGSSPERLRNIQAFGAQASITELNYDDTVRLAKKDAEKYGWVMVQDTAWPGYEEIPGWIMEGYTTIALEAARQLEQAGAPPPTHIFLQAGVGSLAGSLAGSFASLYGGQRPVVTVVEPNRADCLYRTAKAGDGRPCFVTGPLDTIMAGLACGEPCTLAWQVLQECADHFVSCPDWVAAKGMRVLGNPLPGDARVISGESGAVTLGLVAQVMGDKRLAWLRAQIGLDGASRVLCISTEGDTDKAHYRRIVWDGLYPSR